MSDTVNGSEDLSDIDRRLCRIEKKLDEKITSQHAQSENDEIDIRELWDIIWRGRWIIIGITATFAIVAIIYVVMLPNIYKSTALLAPSEETEGGGLSALAGQFGGLASLAGLGLSDGSDRKIITAIETIRSRQFITNLIEKHDMLIPLMAAKEWDRNANELTIDSEIYDEQTSQWVRAVSPPRTPKPSMWEAHKQMSDILTVIQDKNTGLVSISIEHYSPVIASEWVETIVEEINAVIKDKDIREARKSINFLNQQLEKTSVADMRSVFYQLIEEQTKTIMLADVRDEYIFTVIDPAVVPEEKYKPKRAIFVIVVTILGALVSLICVFAFESRVLHRKRRKDINKN